MSCIKSIKDLLELGSIGKHNHGLFFKGRLMYTTALSGLLTLVLVIAAVAYSISIVVGIFQDDEYMVSTQVRDLLTDAKFGKEVTLATFEQNFIQDYQVFYNETLYPDIGCENLTLSFGYFPKEHSTDLVKILIPFKSASVSKKGYCQTEFHKDPKYTALVQNFSGDFPFYRARNQDYTFPYMEYKMYAIVDCPEQSE